VKKGKYFFLLIPLFFFPFFSSFSSFCFSFLGGETRTESPNYTDIHFSRLSKPYMFKLSSSESTPGVVFKFCSKLNVLCFEPGM